MIEINDKSMCCGCTACYNICPVGAIRFQPDSQGFNYPIVDKSKCINCDRCVKVCQYCSQQTVTPQIPKAYAAYNQNPAERERSSSGGIFILLAKSVLEKGGAVVGASFDQRNRVCHKIITSLNDLDDILGSKYVQSDLGNIFRQIEQMLKTGTTVLFSGTGCQINGLRLYLGKDYQTLLCVDVVCLGVPSPAIWEKYLFHYFRDFSISRINFKEKSMGWHNFSLKVTGNREWTEEGRGNKYMLGYFRGYYKRPSCYNCKSKGIRRQSDITLADCWGIEKINPAMDDNQGTSAVLLHSAKGMEYWRQISGQLVFCPINPEDLAKYNKGVSESLSPNRLTPIFWKAVELLPFKMVFSLFCSPSITWRLKHFKKKLLRRR